MIQHVILRTFILQNTGVQIRTKIYALMVKNVIPKIYAHMAGILRKEKTRLSNVIDELEAFAEV